MTTVDPIAWGYIATELRNRATDEGTTEADHNAMRRAAEIVETWKEASAVPIVGPLFDARDTPPERILDDGSAALARTFNEWTPPRTSAVPEEVKDLLHWLRTKAEQELSGRYKQAADLLEGQAIEIESLKGELKHCEEIYENAITYPNDAAS